LGKGKEMSVEKMRYIVNNYVLDEELTHCPETMDALNEVIVAIEKDRQQAILLGGVLCVL
jgi:hypothetical protein